MNIGESSYRRFLAGDESAFDEIIDIYHENLIFFIRRYVHDLTVAEDIAEDCFVALIVYPHRYNFKVSLKTYLFTLARNKSVDYIRHHSVIDITSLDEQAEKSAEYESFESRVLRDEHRRAVNEAMQRLDEKFCTVLHLIYFEELSYEESGRVMGKSRKQIENLAYRARNALRVILNEMGWGDEKQS